MLHIVSWNWKEMLQGVVQLNPKAVSKQMSVFRHLVLSQAASSSTDTTVKHKSLFMKSSYAKDSNFVWDTSRQLVSWCWLKSSPRVCSSSPVHSPVFLWLRKTKMARWNLTWWSSLQPHKSGTTPCLVVFTNLRHFCFSTSYQDSLFPGSLSRHLAVHPDSVVVFSSLFSTGQTAVKLSGAEAADWAQCAAPNKPTGYWNLLVVFANLKRVIQCACFKLLGSRKGTPKCNLHILAVAQHLPRKWRLVSSSSLQRGHNGSLTLRIIVRCRLRVLCPVRR